MNQEDKFIDKILCFLIKKERDLSSKKAIYSEKLKDKYWKIDSKYLNYEIGQAEMELKYINYIKFLLKKRKQLLEEKLKKVDENIQQKIL